MNIVFYGGKQGGLVVLLSILSNQKNSVKVIFAEDKIIENIANILNIPVLDKNKINDEETYKTLEEKRIDLLICCHGRKIIKKPLLNLRCINVHPCLYNYKGADPIGRMIKDNNKKASVAVHWMVEEVDKGGVIVEEFKEVDLDSVVSVYNQLYPLYSKMIIKALEVIRKNEEF